MGADPTWPNRAGYSIPCDVMLGSGGGGGTVGTLSLGSGQRRCGPRERVCFCRVFSLPVSLLFLFPLFAVLLNCPYPDPPVSASFFPFSSARRQGEGRPRGTFVAGGSRNQNTAAEEGGDTVTEKCVQARTTVFLEFRRYSVGSCGSAVMGSCLQRLSPPLLQRWKSGLLGQEQLSRGPWGRSTDQPLVVSKLVVAPSPKPALPVLQPGRYS